MNKSAMNYCISALSVHAQPDIIVSTLIGVLYGKYVESFFSSVSRLEWFVDSQCLIPLSVETGKIQMEKTVSCIIRDEETNIVYHLERYDILDSCRESWLDDPFAPGMINEYTELWYIQDGLYAYVTTSYDQYNYTEWKSVMICYEDDPNTELSSEELRQHGIIK